MGMPSRVLWHHYFATRDNENHEQKHSDLHNKRLNTTQKLTVLQVILNHLSSVPSELFA